MPLTRTTAAPTRHRDFLPQTGTLYHLRAPEESANVRVDTGVRSGDTVSIFYDPMISKLITYGAHPAAAPPPGSLRALHPHPRRATPWGC